MSRKISEIGLKLIKNFEGCRLTAYKPIATETYYTIGWGHYGPDVTKGMTITQAQADSMLINDMAKYESYVNNTSYVPVTAQLNQNQFDALVSFCYNCGNGNLKSLCKGRTITEIAANITKYNKSSGTVLAGLVKRRAAELELFNKTIKETVSIKTEETFPTMKAIFTVDNSVVEGIIKDGSSHIPATAMTKLGDVLSWDNTNKKLSINGIVVDTYLKDNSNYISGATIKTLGHKVSWDNATKKLYLSK